MAPQDFYLATLALFAGCELVCQLRGRGAFGRLLWVVLAVTAWGYLCLYTGIDLPVGQLISHAIAFPVGMTLARGIPSHCCAGLYFPMLTVDALCVAHAIDPATWWWSLFYLACAQLIAIGAGSELHRLGKWLRRLSGQIHNIVSHEMRRAWGH